MLRTGWGYRQLLELPTGYVPVLFDILRQERRLDEVRRRELARR